MNKFHGVAAVLALGLGLITTHIDSAGAQAPPPFPGAPIIKKGAPPAPAPQRQVTKRKDNTGRNIAAGVAAGVVGAIILNEASRASGGDDGEGRHSCRSLERRCDDGQDWACRRFDRNC